MVIPRDTVWRRPVFLPYLQPPLTLQDIQDAERTIGHQLPPAYLDILRVQNGGYIRCMLPDCCHDTIAGLGPHFPRITVFGDDSADYCSLNLNGLVGIDGDGHWFLCLDYRKGRKEPSIAYVDVETDHEKNIADSFEHYL